MNVENVDSRVMQGIVLFLAEISSRHGTVAHSTAPRPQAHQAAAQCAVVQCS